MKNFEERNLEKVSQVEKEKDFERLYLERKGLIKTYRRNGFVTRST